MTALRDADREALRAAHDLEYRDPADVIAYPGDLADIDPRLLVHEISGDWWEILGERGVTLLVSREYEHLLISLSVDEAGAAVIGMMKMPHPSGIAMDLRRGVVHVACTRNPNRILDLAPVQGLMPRSDIRGIEVDRKPLVPVAARFLPGCFYIHDLAMVAGELHGNSVGQNAVVRISDSGNYPRVWWPRCIETENGPIFGQNHLQLNSIAAGDSLEDSFFSASTEEITAVRPGDPSFPVDRRGVVFSGRTREPIARGLTRPHSARLHGGNIWVDNSGYGEVGVIRDGGFEPVAAPGGWTRGLSFCDSVLFVGTSRVLPRFESYAPGLEPEAARCGVHAVDASSGALLGSIVWPWGSQIFSVECIPRSFSSGLPFRLRADDTTRERALFYAFQLAESEEG